MISESFRLAWPLALEAALRSGELEQGKALSEHRGGRAARACPRVPGRAAIRGYAAFVAIGTDESGTLEADLASALDRFRVLGYPYWLARSQADLGRWLESQDRREEGIQLFAAAHKTFAMLGVRPEADAIRAAVGNSTLRRSQDLRYSFAGASMRSAHQAP